MANAERSNCAKHVVRGKMLQIFSSVTMPAVNRCISSGTSAGGGRPRVLRNLITAAAEAGVSRGTSRRSAWATRQRACNAHVPNWPQRKEATEIEVFRLLGSALANQNASQDS
eukprot:7377762-Prymnesium_polylepis.1